MAERRMFSKGIIQAGKFLRMPPTARLLYYDLGMTADDDGIVEAYTVMTQTKATEDDLRILVAKGYVRILNEDLVAYICDWNTNNSIRGDRYHESIYKDLLLQLGDGLTTTWQPSDNQMETEVRLGKDSIGKVSLGKTKKSAKAPVVYYPDNEALNEAFNRFIDHRKKLKKPMSEYACEQAVKKLNKLSGGETDTAIAIINQSIDECWQGLFELKPVKGQNSPQKEQSIVDMWLNA